MNADLPALPKKVIIRGLIWCIKEVPGDHPVLEKDAYSKERQYYGCCDKYGDYGPELTIYIRKGLSLQVGWETLFHELAHAIAYGFKPFDLKKEMPVEIFAGEVFSACRQWHLL